MQRMATWDPKPNGWMTWPGNWSCVRWYDFNGRWCWTGSRWQANSMNREHRQQLLLLFTTDDVPSYKTHLCKIVYGFRRGLSFIFNTTTIARALETKWSCFNGFLHTESDLTKTRYSIERVNLLFYGPYLLFPVLSHPWRIIKSIYATTGKMGRCEFHFPWRSPTQRAIT